MDEEKSGVKIKGLENRSKHDINAQQKDLATCRLVEDNSEDYV